MKDKKFYKLIQKEGESLPKKKAAWDKIVSETGWTPDEKKIEAKAAKTKKKRAIFAFAAGAAAVLISLSVGLALFIPKPAPENKSRYCSTEDYRGVVCEYTLEELAQVNDAIFYLNWDIPLIEELRDKKDDELLAYSFAAANVDTGVMATFYILRPLIHFDFVDEMRQSMEDNFMVDAITVFYLQASMKSYAYFEFKNYTYYLFFDMPYEDEIIIDTMTELISSKN